MVPLGASSELGKSGDRSLIAYCASKAAVRGITQSSGKLVMNAFMHFFS